jgi:DNA-binding CsgD family transcriptional regulator
MSYAGRVNYANGKGKLTLAEMRVYNEAITPKSNKDICKALNLGRSTVTFHLRRIYKKLKCQDRLELLYRFSSFPRGTNDNLPI